MKTQAQVSRETKKQTASNDQGRIKEEEIEPTGSWKN